MDQQELLGLWVEGLPFQQLFSLPSEVLAWVNLTRSVNRSSVLHKIPNSILIGLEGGVISYSQCIWHFPSY